MAYLFINLAYYKNVTYILITYSSDIKAEDGQGTMGQNMNNTSNKRQISTTDINSS